ncbi:MAG: YjdF family protein [Propionibacterium acidifaciens]
MPTTASPSTTFTVNFTGRFWVGVYEHHDHGWVRAARVAFGSEPGEAELYEWLLAHGGALGERAARAPWVREGREGVRGRMNPKRAQRQAAKEAARPRASTAAQEAVRAEQEARAAAAGEARRQDREEERERRRGIRRARARARHRGR